VESITRVSVTKNLELVRKATLLVLRKRLEAAHDFEVELTAGMAFIPAAGVTMHALDAGRASRPEEDEAGDSGEGKVRAPFRQLIELPEGADLAFTVRNRRPGDRFQPLGMDRPKKLKDFFIDRKIDADVRDRLPLLVWNGEIVWIPGVEVSERFKVRGAGGHLCEVWTDERHDQSGLQR
jgi:tRNA(Ile)-lysidine synthetase-like protein